MRHGRRGVEIGEAVVGFGAQFDARDVGETDQRAVGVGADDDVLEFIHVREPALGFEGIADLLVVGDRHLSDLARGDLDVLFAHRLGDVGDADAEAGHAAGSSQIRML